MAYYYNGSEADLNQNGIVMGLDPADQYIHEQICAITDTLGEYRLTNYQTWVCTDNGTNPGASTHPINTDPVWSDGWLSPIPNNGWPLTWAEQTSEWTEEYNETVVDTGGGGTTTVIAGVTLEEQISVISVGMAFLIGGIIAYQFRFKR